MGDDDGMSLAYALFLWVAGDMMLIATFATVQECEVYKAQQSERGINGKCLWMEEKRV